MARKQRTRSADLTNIQMLAQDPQAFHIFHALRVIEAEYDDQPRLGRSIRPKQDRIRLSQEAEPAFPTSTIAEFEVPNGVNPGKLVNRFFGLFGPNGPLPLHLTEYARDRARNNHDTTFTAFANIFTHRMLSLLYRAWANGQPAPSFDRVGEDPFEDKVAALAGHYGVHLRERDAMPDMAKRHFSGHLTHGPKNAEGLLSIVSSFFTAPTRIEDFIGSWLELEQSDQWKLGGQIGLGRGTSLGHRVWSRSSKFRIVIGPLPIEDFRRMLPGGVSLARLGAIVRNYLGDVFDWDVNIILRREDVPEPILGVSAALGQTCWIGNLDTGRDPDDLYLQPNSMHQYSS